jgi:hypothetical protein
VRPDRQCSPLAIAALPTPSLTVFHQCTVHLGVRRPSLDIILLDFDAIAGDLSVSVNDLAPELVAGSTHWLTERCSRERTGHRPVHPLYRRPCEDWLCFDRVKSQHRRRTVAVSMEGDSRGAGGSKALIAPASYARLLSTAAEPLCAGKGRLIAVFSADRFPRLQLPVPAAGSGSDAEAANFFEQGLDLSAIGWRRRA